MILDRFDCKLRLGEDFFNFFTTNDLKTLLDKMHLELKG